MSLDKVIGLEEDRRFQLWYYTVSLRQALLRSVGKGKEENIDVIFQDISYIEIPTDINGIKIVTPSEDDKRHIEDKIGIINQKVTVLICEGKKYYIVSSGVYVSKNNLDFFEIPFDIGMKYIANT